MNGILDSEIVQYVLGTVIVAVAASAGGALALFALKHAAKQARDLWYYLRRYVPDAVAAVDEPTDPVIVMLARYVPVLARVAPLYAPVFIRAFAKAVDEVLDTPDPVREVNTGGAVR